MESDLKKLLAVSWATPPLLFPRSIQVARTLKGLSLFGWQADVLRAAPQAISSVRLDPALEEKYAPFYRAVSVASDEEALFWRVLRKAFFFFDQSPFFQRTWMQGAIQKGLQLLAAERFSAIISFAQPWSGHLIGLRLKRLTRLPWVAHFSDPWADNPFIRFKKFQGAFLRKMEETVVREADALVFVSARTQKLTMSKYPPTWRGKAYVIPHCYEAPQAVSPRAKNDKLRLCHIGNFYGARTPETFLRALALLNQKRPLQETLEVSFWGKDLRRFQPLVQALALQSFVLMGDSVSHLESAELSAQADALLLIDAPNESESVFLPSKLVDYLAFQKPILGITPLEGASADLLREAGCPVAAPQDVAQIASAVEDLLDRGRAGALKVSPQFASVAARYEISQTAAVWNQLLTQLVRTRL